MPIFILFSFLFLKPAWATFDVPTLTGPVVDNAALMTSGENEELSQALKKIHSAGGPQINVLTVESIDPLTIEEASIKVAQEWALGGKKEDNGLLLMVAKKEKKVRIEVGQGLEGDLTDAYSKRIIDYDIVPQFRHGNFGLGIIAGVRGMLLRMNPPLRLEDYIGDKYSRDDYGDAENINVYVILFIIFVFIVFGFLGGGFRGGGSGYYGDGDFFGGGGFGGSSGGGGWSGGGGGFSGGGASGSW